MSTDTPTSSTGAAASPGALRIGFFAMMRKFFTAISEGADLFNRYRLLARLSNEERAALGLDRRDIPRVAVNGWKR